LKQFPIAIFRQVKEEYLRFVAAIINVQHFGYNYK